MNYVYFKNATKYIYLYIFKLKTIELSNRTYCIIDYFNFIWNLLHVKNGIRAFRVLESRIYWKMI